jgi:lysophospholipase L1-like esterase
MLYKNILFHNVAELIEEDGGLLINRIPENVRLKLNQSAVSAARQTAGCELRFNLKSQEGKITLLSNGIVEVYQGAFQKTIHLIDNKTITIPIALPGNIKHLNKVSKENKLPFDANLVRVILPYRGVTKIIDIEGDFGPPSPSQMPKLNYLAYGSSITHGATSISPSGTYIMRTATRLGVNLFNLGFGGGAHFENQMADYISERKDWHFASFEIGVNMLASFTVEEFKSRVEYFLGKISKQHPDKYLFCIDIFTIKRDRDTIDPDKLKQFRKVVKALVKTLNSEKVIHLDGRRFLKDISGLTFDLGHPSPAGMEEISLNLSKALQPYLKQLLQK